MKQPGSVNNLEYELFRTVCIIAAGATIILMLYDGFGEDYTSVKIEFIGFFFFTTFYFLSKKRNIYKYLPLPFTLILYFIMDVGWYFGGGLNRTVSTIFLLVFLLSTSIIPKKIRVPVLLGAFINLAVIVYLEHIGLITRTELDNKLPNQMLFSNILFGILLGLAIFIIYYVKMKYESLSNQLTRLNNSLDKKVKNRTKTLRALNKDLDTLFYRSSHDFRRPLTTLMGLANIQQAVPDPMIQDISKHMDTTIKDMDQMLLKFNMLYEINKFKPSNGYKVNLEDQITQSLMELKSNDDVELDLNIQIDLKNHTHDRILEFIILCLSENAFQFRKDSRVKIDCKISETDKNININFTDYGVGIPDSIKDKVFDMYYRGSTRSKGNGLGLYVVKKATQRMGGSVTLDNLADKTKFRISLPVNKPLNLNIDDPILQN